ncbi:hypothetical protein DQ04_10911000 [Trypanosoma grayi]|uniref:hypothetical protein n=1 Tax=Trypanosoma grayi TaxID=71804 RepID=UPI0004F4B536|nr:hypothetical protein DQ04_10911000 [Trypanosoma grayi]KEG07099.1 hypothetical protein DQ04_10911000 [Trypanosoma grayi]
MMATVRRVMCVLALALCCVALCVAAEPQQEPLEKYVSRASPHSGGVPSATAQVGHARRGAVKAVEASVSRLEPGSAMAASSNTLRLTLAAKEVAENAKTDAVAAVHAVEKALTNLMATNSTVKVAYEALSKLNKSLAVSGKKYGMFKNSAEFKKGGFRCGQKNQ